MSCWRCLMRNCSAIARADVRPSAARDRHIRTGHRTSMVTAKHALPRANETSHKRKNISRQCRESSARRFIIHSAGISAAAALTPALCPDRCLPHCAKAGAEAGFKLYVSLLGLMDYADSHSRENHNWPWGGRLACRALLAAHRASALAQGFIGWRSLQRSSRVTQREPQRRR